MQKAVAGCDTFLSMSNITILNHPLVPYDRDKGVIFFAQGYAYFL